MASLFGARQAQVRPLLLGLTLASCVLLGIEKAGLGWLLPVRSVLATMVVPVQYVAESPHIAMDHLIEFFSARSRLMRRNASLERELLMARSETARTDAILAENDRLRELFNLPARLPDDLLIAELIEVIPDPTRYEIVVDKGGAHGVAVGQAVIDSAGVFGQVVETTPLTGRVLLVTDPSHAIPVQVIRSKVFAIASGGGKGPHLLDNPPVTTDIVAGDNLVSSGLGRRFPRDYPVGVVTRVVKDPTQQYAQVVWEPSAELARSRLVLVVLGGRQDAEPSTDAVAEIGD
ncbi:MAG: rod shape-determining protein MreC [Gammaproteobacteria bacterium]|nr:rod shape-determining protein MreC [Gammaproteobacteria bacterium]MXY54870.1 rod shape-determining protein MreC [Gammaproteobacteria bacterium]MYF30867.1 rod shape-determining protein MreC [Gammaproteobacteria bacterium]MYK46490.1 rod shape-determining protein MreC [Gammaproteobacteria bacterium]